MTNHPEAGEKIFKKGEVIYQQGDYVSAIYDVLYGQVAPVSYTHLTLPTT